MVYGTAKANVKEPAQTLFLARKSSYTLIQVGASTVEARTKFSPHKMSEPEHLGSRAVL